MLSETKKVLDLIKSSFDAADDAATLRRYSRDASIFEVRPQIVVYPKNARDVQDIVRLVNEHPEVKLSLTARSAGTDMSGGAIGESIILDFTRHMQGVLKVGADYAVTLPGTFYRDFEKETLKHGLIYPAYPASKSICAMGGIVANNGAGEKTLRYGKAENYVRELKAVFADGNEYVVKPLSKSELEIKIAQGDFEGSVYRDIWNMIQANKEKIAAAKPDVSKNSAGYYLWNVMSASPADSSAEEADEGKPYFDLTKLLVGSQGTLAIVTEITMRLVPVMNHSRMLVVFLRDLNRLGDIVRAILLHGPESVESYDDKTLGLAIRFWKGFIKKRGIFGFLRMGISFLPEFFMLFRGGMPKLVLLIEFAGNDREELARKINETDEALMPFKIQTRIIHTKVGVEKYWSIRRDSFTLLREKVKGKHTAPFIDDIIVKPDYLPEFLPKLDQILADYPIEYTIAGHAGDGNFHIIPLMDFKDPDTGKIILELGEKVYDLVLSYQGSITAEHNDGIIRTPYLVRMFGLEIEKLFQETKLIFDPKNILNPGKKVRGTKEYIKEHLVNSEKEYGS